MTLAVTGRRVLPATIVMATAVTALLGACTSYESAYEKAVYDDEPIYCYRSLAGADCYRTAYRRDDRRLINYYGPAPSKYEPPSRPAAAPLRARLDSGDGEGVVLPAAASTTAGSPPKAGASDEGEGWRGWLPLFSVAFGALQLVAAFVM